LRDLKHFVRTVQFTQRYLRCNGLSASCTRYHYLGKLRKTWRCDKWEQHLVIISASHFNFSVFRTFS